MGEVAKKFAFFASGEGGWRVKRETHPLTRCQAQDRGGPASQVGAGQGSAAEKGGLEPERSCKPPGQATSAPYVRWYCKMAEEDRVPWADQSFDQFRGDWARPSFFPANSFVLPFCPESGTLDPSRDWFPARGLFVSAQGARTRLHKDPWCSDALLCQVFGKKNFVMYDPAQAPYLTHAEKTVDIEAPDLDAFPDFPRARPTLQGTLEPGEIVLVPAGWFHHFNSVTDSISLTWNFVHFCRVREFVSYLLHGPNDTERKQLAYAYFRSPGSQSPART
jgi:hypothetical protein